MANQELLLTLSRENETLRNQASKSVEDGMETILSTKRIIQKLSISNDARESVALACSRLMNAGIALRVMLQAHKRHHQRQEAPWIDAEGSTGHLLRTSLHFQEDAEKFANELRLALKEVRLEVKESKRTRNAQPEKSTNWAPINSSTPSIE
jgi:hypothetical protein